MLRKWIVPLFAVMALTLMTPLDASAQMGKKGNGNNQGEKADGDKKEDKKPEKKDDDKGGSRGQGNKGQESKPQDKKSDDNKGQSLGKGRPEQRKERTAQDRQTGRDFQIESKRKSDVFQKAQPSRSGAVRYGSSSNLLREDRGRTSVNIPEAPKFTATTRGERDVWREDRTRTHDNRYRSGYVQYSPWWNDDYFYYPHYAFNYIPGRCVPSPFYYYSNVPGYVVSARVQIGNFSFQIYARDRYTWHRPTYRDDYDYRRDDRRRYNDVDYVIDDLVTAFERGRMHYADDLVPNGYVDVALEDYAHYRMRGDDFYDMFADIVEGTDTIEYDIRDVRYSRGQIVIRAEHEFRDAYGRRDRKYHTIVLQERGSRRDWDDDRYDRNDRYDRDDRYDGRNDNGYGYSASYNSRDLQVTYSQYNRPNRSGWEIAYFRVDRRSNR